MDREVEKILAYVYPGDGGGGIEFEAAGRGWYSKRYSRIPPITFLT